MYNKIFTKILDSSIWLEPNATRIVWFTFLAAMDEDGFAQFAAAPNLAHRARVSLKEAELAIKTLEAEDPNSSDPDHEGRRIERVPGGWMVLNATKYKGLVTRIIAREKTRLRVERHRAKGNEEKPPVTPCNADVTVIEESKRAVTPSVSVSVSYSDSVSEAALAADREISARREKKTFPLLEEVLTAAEMSGIPREVATNFWNHFESTGWKDKHNVDIHDWRPKLQTWKVISRERDETAKRNGDHRNPVDHRAAKAAREYPEKLVAKRLT